MKAQIIALCLFGMCFSLALGITLDSPEEYREMDAIAIEAGTDKSSLFHDYTRIYSNYFKELRNQPIRFLEIGIYRGDSVKLWENYFPNAELHFIDITSQYLQYSSSRSSYHFIDQENIEALRSFAETVGGQFDVIIDDGGHFMRGQINSLIALFPFVKAGGMYIIEDLHTSYWREFGGGGTRGFPRDGRKTALAFLKNLINSANAVGAKSGQANFYRAPPELMSQLTDWEKEIRSIHFYDSVGIIFKR